jgi:mevalonate kinase
VETLDPPIASLPFVSAFTGVRHQSGEVHAPVRERWLAGEPRVVSAYARITKLAGLGKRAFLTGSWRDLGDLMNENHAIHRELGGAGEVNERLIQVAREAGALGAKLAGAGNGGTIVALCADGEGEVERVEAALLSAGAAAIYRPTSVPGVRIDVG